MVSIDTVYQKVLALTNKEQRGYVTPQEFNLLADKAQMEIYHNYFHNIKTAYHKPKNQMGGSDEIEMLHERLHPFKAQLSVLQMGGNALLNIGGNMHFINTVTNNGREVVELTEKEVANSENNPLTRATADRQVYTRSPGYGTLRLYPTPTASSTYWINYWIRPKPPRWAYVVVNEKALYNSNLSADFILHSSEEENIVTRILQLAGVVIEKPGIVEIAMADQASIKREQND